MNEVTQAIDRLVEQRTFGLEALDAIKELRDKAAELERKTNAQSKRIDEQVGMLQQRDDAIRGAEAEKAALDARETALAAREAKIADLEKKVAVAEAVSGTWTSCFDKLFANRTVRETLVSSVPIERQFGNNGGNYIETHIKRDEIAREEC